jgi:hypothetical protein
MFIPGLPITVQAFCYAHYKELESDGIPSGLPGLSLGIVEIILRTTAKRRIKRWRTS